jgi:hypothetical protein
MDEELKIISAPVLQTESSVTLKLVLTFRKCDSATHDKAANHRQKND